MAAAATARRAAAPARAPSRKAPARKKPAALKVATARTAPARKVATARTAPARKAPARRKAPSRRPGGQLIPIAVGTATAVRHLPDSSLMVRMTSGRLWIGVLGVLLAGIVAVNVVTLSIAASAGHVDQNIQALDQENSILRGRDAQRSGSARVRHDAAAQGLTTATTNEIRFVQAGPRDVAVAAQRLAAAGSGY
jgi:hypothetical protein